MEFEEAMKIALAEAQKAFEEGEVPIGAVVLHNGKVISVAHNTREGENKISGHAEILALEAAAKILGRWQLSDCQLVVTLEPCTMCAGAIGQSRVATLVYGADDSKYGAFSNGLDPFTKKIYPSPLIYRGICQEEGKALLDKFFQLHRA